MSLITPNKTVGRSLLAWQDVNAAAIVIGSPLDVSTMFAVAVQIRMGRRTGTAFTAGSPNFRIEASVKSSGNDHWVPLGATFQPALGALIANTTLNGAVLAGATSFVVAANTNISVGDVLFLSDSAQANYELCRVKTVAGTTITPEEALTSAHANAAIVTDQAETYFPSFDVTAYSRIRAVVDNLGSGQAISIEVLATTHDSYTAT